MDKCIFCLLFAILCCSLYSQLYQEQKQYHVMVVTKHVQNIFSRYVKQFTDWNYSQLLSIEELKTNKYIGIIKKSISNQWEKIGYFFPVDLLILRRFL